MFEIKDIKPPPIFDRETRTILSRSTLILYQPSTKEGYRTPIKIVIDDRRNILEQTTLADEVIPQSKPRISKRPERHDQSLRQQALNILNGSIASTSDTQREIINRYNEEYTKNKNTPGCASCKLNKITRKYRDEIIAELIKEK